MRRFSRGGNTRTKRAYVTGLALLLGCLACVAPVAAQTSQGRWLRIPSTPLDAPEQGPAGSLLVIEAGVRIELRADGSMAQSSELLPPGTQQVQLPPWLGPGFVFWSHVERSTWLWRSDTFTGPLQPLAQFPTVVQRVVPAFDRLLVWAGANQPVRALDARTGQVLDIAALPTSSAHAAMAFASPSFGAVVTDVRGTQVTFDAGATWHPLGIDDLQLQLEPAGDQIELRSNHDRYLIDQRGTIRLVEPVQDSAVSNDGSGDDEDDDTAAVANPTSAANSMSPLAAWAAPPLVTAILHGFSSSADRAIVVHQGILAEVRLGDGALVRHRAISSDWGPTRCQALHLGRGHGFACVDASGTTSLYRYQTTFSLTRLVTFLSPRAVRVSGTGGLVIDGPCTAERRAGDDDLHCTYDGKTWREVHHQTEPRERVALTRQGRFVTIRPPDAKRAGSVLEIRDGKPQARPLQLGGLSEKLRAMLRVGRWLDPLVEGPHGELMTWVVSDQQFVGVKVKRDGQIEVGPLRTDRSSTLFNGPIALTLSAGAVGYESRNAGFDWYKIELPTSVTLPNPYGPPNETNSPENWGCSALGCVFGNWLRIADGTGGTLTQAKAPARANVAKSGLPGWTMDCRPASLSSAVHQSRRPSLLSTVATETRARAAGERSQPPFDSIVNSPWRSFLGEAPPALASHLLGLDIGNDEYRTQFRAYAWGPRSNDWANEARWQARMANRFDVDSTWASLVTRTPWTTPVIAAQAFGQGDQSSELVDWSATLDAKGDAGLLRVLTRVGSQLFWAEKDRPIQAIAQVAQLDLQKPLSLARLQGHRYVAAEHDDALVVFELEADQLQPLGRYPLLAADATKVQIVSSRAADALAIWVKTADRGWFLFPLDTQTGAALPGQHVPVERLNGVPRTCSAEDQGWQLVSDVPLATLGGSSVNTWLAFTPQLDQLKARDIEARVLVTHSDVCLEAVAGQLEGVKSVSKRSATQAAAASTPVAATLTDRATGRRFGFRCTR